MFRYLTKRQWVLILLGILLVVAGYYILPVSVPLIVAFVTALFLNPSVRWFQFRFRINRKMAVTIVFLLFLIFISIIGSYAVTRAVSQIVQIADNVPTYVNQVNGIIADWEESMDRYAQNLPEEVVNNLTEGIKRNVRAMTDSITANFQLDRMASAAAKIPEYLVSILVYLIALFLFMLELPRLKEKAYQHFTEDTAEKVKFMNARLSYVVFGFLKAQFFVSLIILFVSFIGLIWIAPEVAILMSIIIWLIDFIPIIGSIIILGPWALFDLLSGNIVSGTKLAILAFVLLAIRRTVEPKVMGRHIGLSPLATLIAMYLGLQLIGVIGFILGPLLLIAFNSAKEAGIIKLNYKI
ncbi:sporulation integral membrane protein YtvI [Thalassobacillus sp. CUG 92003]|uniref:sporulation integral membrane protein YtvI n=1 Tax=Thalassobacillus sp. CUG 92003 TaxID=2736641 RepID=UPI0015E71CEC|nr:sporulation integral membrane protein YtvI [Thalassobacillus sp. CUG 92003]